MSKLCLNIDQLTIYNNPNGTISTFTISPSTGELIPYKLTKPCCENIGGVFDIVTQKCFKGKIIDGCDYVQPFNLVLNPVGNDGTIFSEITNETCTLEVQFDYLFKFDCNKLSEFIDDNNISSCTSLDQIFENIGASMSIEKITALQTGTISTSIYEEEFFTPIGPNNLLNYLQDNSGNTGFYICRLNEETSDCVDLDLADNVFLPRSNCAKFAEQMLITHPTIPSNSFNSDWLTFTTEISDETILSAITNEKIKLVIKLSGFCIDMCVLVDNIRLNQKCTKSLKDEIFILKSPGFKFDRIIDNKKSWVSVNETTHREFSVSKFDGGQPIRYTDYYLENDRQLLNTKEIDLDIDIASAIETDVWCYIFDNPCLLTGETIGTTTCVKNTLLPFTGFSTNLTSSTVVTLVYTACTVDVLSSTTISNPSITAYTCPIGYSATPANDQCQSIIIQPAETPTNLGPTVLSGDKNGDNYGILGAYFYPTIANVESNSELPYSYQNDNLLYDALGNVVTPVSINNTNPFWASLNSSSNGRLNNAGVLSLDDTWAGFTKCIDIISGGTYYIGIAADSNSRFFVNGVLVADFRGAIFSNFTKWSIFPIEFNSGLNIIEVQGFNAGTRTRTNLAAFAAEIYYPIDFTTLYNATGSTQANTLFTTASKIGGTYDVGDTFGYSCPTGYIFNNCSSPACASVKTLKIRRTITPVADTVITTVITSATTCPGLSAVTVTGNAVTFISGDTCLPKTYCCSEYCGDANIDIERLFTQPLSGVTTIEDFEYYTTSQLIDVKNRQTITSYPTLRLLYDRYMNSTAFCNTSSARFQYSSMNQFANLVGNYWVDLIEQVVPATTIWGSTKIYTNTMFDTQKYKYKAYTTLFGNPSFKNVLSPVTGATCGVDTITMVITAATNSLPQFNQQAYSTVYLTQMNSGSEFIGNVTVLSKDDLPCLKGEIVNCDLAVTIDNRAQSDNLLVAVPSNYFGNVTYNWVTPLEDSSAQSVSATVNGEYVVTITDDCCTAVASIKIDLF